MRPTTLGRAVCFPSSTNSDVNLVQKHSQRHTRKNICPNVWAPHGPVKWMYEVNHHRSKGRATILILKLWQLIFESCVEGYFRELDLYPFFDLTLSLSSAIICHLLLLWISLGKT